MGILMGTGPDVRFFYNLIVFFIQNLIPSTNFPRKDHTREIGQQQLVGVGAKNGRRSRHTIIPGLPRIIQTKDSATTITAATPTVTIPT